MPRTYNCSSDGSLGTAVSERKLIYFSHQGDRDAFACLYDTYLDRIHRHIYFRGWILKWLKILHHWSFSGYGKT